MSSAACSRSRAPPGWANLLPQGAAEVRGCEAGEGRGNALTAPRSEDRLSQGGHAG